MMGTQVQTLKHWPKNHPYYIIVQQFPSLPFFPQFLNLFGNPMSPNKDQHRLDCRYFLVDNMSNKIIVEVACMGSLH